MTRLQLNEMRQIAGRTILALALICIGSAKSWAADNVSKFVDAGRLSYSKGNPTAGDKSFRAALKGTNDPPTVFFAWAKAMIAYTGSKRLDHVLAKRILRRATENLKYVSFPHRLHLEATLLWARTEWDINRHNPLVAPEAPPDLALGLLEYAAHLDPKDNRALDLANEIHLEFVWWHVYGAIYYKKLIHLFLLCDLGRLPSIVAKIENHRWFARRYSRFGLALVERLMNGRPNDRTLKTFKAAYLRGAGMDAAAIVVLKRLSDEATSAIERNEYLRAAERIATEAGPWDDQLRSWECSR